MTGIAAVDVMAIFDEQVEGIMSNEVQEASKKLYQVWMNCKCDLKQR
jgi:hypothetical protein